MPGLMHVLHDVQQISARSLYEMKGSTPTDWKIHAFRNETLRKFGDADVASSNKRKNVLSLGDGMGEREALLQVTGRLPNCRAKSLKLRERPSIPQICQQLMLVTKCFGKIVHHNGNLDLHFQ
eukprot:gnl/TRDRNA2_/TRDRNA2_92546_c0_seq1.p1 gnl/TRDRNA2_/TRDRNA2_92546_c0~~gnl/TRDRNA2_/TRDRNA2_92546_c0_seq1.p1  ORF type:complete len:123 (-),score=21.16 gnl/TRDRNA2_/TRDRNA2_92546_c0_seq1:93-461(-)